MNEWERKRNSSKHTQIENYTIYHRVNICIAYTISYVIEKMIRHTHYTLMKRTTKRAKMNDKQMK